VAEILYYSIPAFVLLLALEAYACARYPAAERLGYGRRDTWASLSLGLANVLLSLAGKTLALFLWTAAYEWTPLDAGRGAFAWALVFPLEDLCYYGFHRAHHEIRFFWAAHVNHHSSRYFNLSTALRQSWTTPFTGPWFWIPLALLGFHPALILTAQAVSLIYQFWIHTEWIGRLGPFEWVFNTPSHHRVHHGRNLQYLDRNYAGILIVWDRLFGSFESERERVDYGLTKNLSTYHPLAIAFHEWRDMLNDARRARDPFTALRHLLAPPGWSPDGRTLTARQMQLQRAGAARG
jgi:sterol desaturase/sphingolipid hydroxylase (fatty acid hydroxylase superfamily)